MEQYKLTSFANSSVNKGFDQIMNSLGATYPPNNVKKLALYSHKLTI